MRRARRARSCAAQPGAARRLLRIPAHPSTTRRRDRRTRRPMAPSRRAASDRRQHDPRSVGPKARAVVTRRNPRSSAGHAPSRLVSRRPRPASVSPAASAVAAAIERAVQPGLSSSIPRPLVPSRDSARCMNPKRILPIASVRPQRVHGPGRNAALVLLLHAFDVLGADGIRRVAPGSPQVREHGR